MSGKKNHRGFGHLRRLPSRRWQATYVGPDSARHTGLTTYDAKGDAEAWLTQERHLIATARWTSPAHRARAVQNPEGTLAAYSERWVRNRDLKPRTHAHYRSLLDKLILPALGGLPLASITPEVVSDWYGDLDKTRPTLRSHAYSLLRTIIGSAVQDRRIETNPCHIRGAGNVKRAHQIEPATLVQLEALVSAMPERYRLMPLLASWCAMRFGELIELRLRDLDLANCVVKIRRGAVRADGAVLIGDPKSEAGRRDVAIPPHLMPLVHGHLARSTTGGKDDLLFPAADGTSTLAPSTFYRVYYPAREAAGRPDLRFHDLRHTGAVLAAQTGATLAELMSRLGHSTPAAAMRYQHAARGRDAEIAAALSRMVERQQNVPS